MFLCHTHRVQFPTACRIDSNMHFRFVEMRNVWKFMYIIEMRDEEALDKQEIVCCLGLSEEIRG
uniref:Uncharacterized protein n=1 Tax=Arundo donax TaxID=35708 RepID=A0A0A9ATZ3_ARUDO